MKSPVSNSESFTKLSERLKYSDLFKKLSDPAFLIDATDFQILELNPAAERIFGEPESQTFNRDFRKNVAEDARDEFEKAIRRSMRRYHPHVFESRVLNFIMEISSCPLFLSEEEKPVLQLILKDITQKRKAERELAEAHEHLKKLSTTDGMTGLLNFRSFQEALKKEHERAKRYDSCYSVVFCDLDHFKHYNDKHGHPAGDELLRQLGAVIKSNVRATDQVFRYGGEEFVVLMPESGEGDALKLAERVRSAIQGFSFQFANEQPMGFVSMSIGIGCYPDHAQESSEVVETADQQVYLAKRGGRNRVCAPIRDPLKKTG